MKKNKYRDKKYTAVIRIKNLTLAQSIAIEDMMRTWQSLGSLGASRWTSFFADGDGNFRPRILYNGYTPRNTKLLDEEQTWKGNEYRIDFDSIAWKLHDNESTVAIESKRFGFLRTFFGTIKANIQLIIKEIQREIDHQRNWDYKGMVSCTSTLKNISKEPMKSEESEESNESDESCEIDQRS